MGRLLLLTSLMVIPSFPKDGGALPSLLPLSRRAPDAEVLLPVGDDARRAASQGKARALLAVLTPRRAGALLPLVRRDRSLLPFDDADRSLPALLPLY